MMEQLLYVEDMDMSVVLESPTRLQSVSVS